MNIKIKYLLMGILIGLLFSFLSNLIFDKSEQAEDQQVNVSEMSSAKETVDTGSNKSNVTVGDNSRMTKNFDSSNEQKPVILDEVVENNQNTTSPNGQTDELDKLFDNFINEQPPELIGLIDMYRRENNQTAMDYKQHLSEDKDTNWAYDAEAFLKNYFSQSEHPEFQLIRVNCRTNTCEVAGTVSVINNDEQYDLSALLSSVVGKIDRGLKNSSSFSNYFYQDPQNYTFSSTLMDINPSPYTFFLERSDND